MQNIKKYLNKYFFLLLLTCAFSFAYAEQSKPIYLAVSFGYPTVYGDISKTPEDACLTFPQAQGHTYVYYKSLYQNCVGTYEDTRGYIFWVDLALVNIRHYCPYPLGKPTTVSEFLSRTNETEFTCETISPPTPEPLQACGIGNPIVPGSGEKLHTETDLTLAGAHPLSFSRYYRTRYAVLPYNMASLGLGAQWMHNYQANLKIDTNKITATRPDSSYALFSYNGTGWAASPLSNQNARDTLTSVLDRGTLLGYSYKVFDTDAVELYDRTGKLISITERNGWRTSLTYSTTATPAAIAPAAGLLIQVSNHFGRSIKLAYNASKQLIKVTDPLGQSVQYAYNGNGVSADSMLIRVTRQDATTRQYHYEQSNTPWGMTGITDELGVRYATYTYDSQGRVSGEAKIGNIDVAGIAYGTAPDYTTTVQHRSPEGALLSQTTIGFTQTETNGRYQPTGSNAPSALCGGYAQSINYDTPGRKASELTHDGKHIAYTYDTKGRQTSRTERTGSASGAITYKATTTYHPTFNLPTLTTEPNKRIAISYDAKGNVLGFVDYTTTDATGSLGLTAPVVSSQTTGWVFNPQQLPVLALYREQKAGASSAPSLFLFTYDTQGNLSQFTQLVNNKLETGKLTAYNANGAFLAGTSTSNQAVKHTYTPRGQLATTNVAGQITTYTNDAIGQSKQVSYPNGDKLNYIYSPAHKLQSIKWNGIEQFTPIAGISSNLASLATLGGYNGISNPELAYKLGVNAATLDALDAAPKVLTQTSNAAAFKAVELAKEAVIGKEARAQAAQAIQAGIRLGGWIGSRFGIPMGVVGAQLGFVEGSDGITRNPTGAQICQNNKDPDKCNKFYEEYQAAKDKANGMKCTPQLTDVAERLRRRQLHLDEAIKRERHRKNCFDESNPKYDSHGEAATNAFNAASNCK